MSRMTDLLDKAAVALANGEDPLANPFLSVNKVTLDECYDLADLLAGGAKLISWAIRSPRAAAAFTEAGVNGMGIAAITEVLRAMNRRAEANRR
jgi:hypothetical protein